jgi:hypothetical protein
MGFLDKPEHLDLLMVTLRRFTPSSMRRLEARLEDLARSRLGREYHAWRDALIADRRAVAATTSPARSSTPRSTGRR